MALIFTALRILGTGNFSTQQVCSEVDFQAALSMVNILVRHSSQVFSELQKEEKTAKPKDMMQQFLDQLPAKFNRTDLIDLAKSLSIAERTAYKYIAIYCEKSLIFRGLHGTYTKAE